MTINHKNNRDGQQDRLFSLLENIMHVTQLIPINARVYYLKAAGKSPMIVKQFPSTQQFQRQKLLTDHLKKFSFPTYQFLTDSDTLLQSLGEYFAIISYIEPSIRKFSFRSETDRLSGIFLLNQFHRITTSLSISEKLLFPPFDQEMKWNIRLQQFKEHLPLFNHLLRRELLDNYLTIANWSLEEMERYSKHLLHEDNVIIHGDCANHNFIRDNRGKLYLIDFDLCARALPIIDDLQYVMRILPFVNWNISSIFSIAPLKKYERHPWFLAALAFPSDVFREINRVLSNASIAVDYKLHYIRKLLVEQYERILYVYHQINFFLKKL
ncbi:aminoglycoside phosphotransferase family protein [Caldibacillus lycopersici]|uniref:Aminoglycoside phosphotransferase family protein n=1 Tax=Perspicuibacillus lycopersici TaxID=1325689 RepID=A0AAE3IUV3_9BACI|nr:aminoglycoside phosphotransferase family protein [Perspicuibacillus lycopersici]MCU9613998.1 aminoglycoside phosphotransferase family protein [Perspicuibacillus lycopersici]